MRIKKRAGIDVGGSKLLVAVWHEDRLDSRETATGPSATPSQLAETAIGLLNEMGGTSYPVGMAVPGLVDSSGTIADCDVLPGLKGWRPIESLPGLSAVLNDGEAALAFAAQGREDEQVLAVVGAGTGTAAAIRIGGKSIRSFRPMAVELGYIPFGREGRLDDHAPGQAIFMQTGLTPQRLHEALEQSQEQATAAVQRAGDAFGLGLATLVNLLQPGYIGLYGGTLRYPGYLQAAMASLERASLAVLRKGCRVEVMQSPELVVAGGAALASA